MTNPQDEIAPWLADRYGLDLAVFGTALLNEAITARCRANGLRDAETYLAHWRNDARERMAFLDRFLIGETWFFREWGAYELLMQWLAQHGRNFSSSAPLRLLTLPCATGEEAWSIAAVVHESGLDAARVEIEAMDLSPSALEQAEQGLYPQRRLRGQPVERWAHLFHLEPGGILRIDASLRAMVRFLAANAMDREFLLQRRPYHIIFCRNMMIYMSGSARGQVCATLARCLEPGGLLFLGHAELVPPEFGLVRQQGSGAFAWCRRTDSVESPGRTPLPPARPDRSPSPRIRPAPTVVRHHAPAYPLAQDSPPLPTVVQGAPDLAEVQRLADGGRYAEALEWLEAPAAQQSLDPGVHGLAGVLLGALNRKQEAMYRLRRALYLDPAHAESLTHLALLLEESGDVAGADRLRKRLAVQSPRTAS